MKWTNGMIKQIAMEQSAIDANCSFKDFVCGKNIVTVSKENELARKYLKLPHVSLSKGYFWDSLTDCLR